MVIHRKHLAGLVLFMVATATAGCGSASTSADSASQEPDPTELAVASVVKKMSNDSNDQFGFSAGQTECVAKGLVDQVGIKALQQYGFLDEKLQPGSGTSGLKMSEVDASASADVVVGCANGEDLLRRIMAEGSLKAATSKCIADTLGDEGARDVFVAVFSGEQDGITEILMSAAVTCPMG